ASGPSPSHPSTQTTNYIDVTVTPPGNGEPMRRIWNPWMDLRGRPHIVLAWDDAAPTAGRIEDHGDIRRIVLDDRLERVERSITLAHELIHDEWNIFYDDDTTDREVELQERRIWREVARRL